MMAKMTFRIALGLIACTAAAPGLSALQTIEDVTCDRGACPRPLELVNETPVTIGLSGQGLSGLTSGVVTDRSGRPIEGVSVVLGEVPRTLTRSLTTTRAVTLTARGVGALTGLQLRFTTSRRGTVTAPLELSVAAVTIQAMPVAPSDPSLAPSRDPNRTITTLEESIERATPRVTEADRPTVTLWAAGPAETVVLEGSALDRVKAARVQHAGRDVPDVRAEVGAGGDATRREISLSARPSARVPWGERLDLVIEARDPINGLPRTYPTPVKVEAWGTIPADDELFLRAINESGALDGASATFNSCGPPSVHRFSVAVPKLFHTRSGSVDRLERGTSAGQRVEFAVDHSLDPSDVFNPQAFGDFEDTRHPSPIPHTVVAVRMCLANLTAGTWRATDVDVTGAVPHLVLTVAFDDALFRARGMPAPPPPLFPTPVHKWGDPITDRELPDLVYASPLYEVRLPMEVSNGRIQYGSPEVRFAGAEPSWSGVFLGASGVRRSMEGWAANRMTGQIRAEVRRPFDAQAARGVLASATWSMLEKVNVSEILGLQKGADGTLQFGYR